MKRYYHPQSNAIKTIHEIRAAYPSASIPDDADLSFMGWHDLTESEKPAYNPITQGLRYRVDDSTGKFVMSWYVYDLPALTVEENMAKFAIQLKRDVVDYAQARLDAFAQTRGYNDILSACTYKGSPVAKFDQEAQRCIQLRSDTWATLYTELEAIESGAKPMPQSADDILSILPELTWGNV